jgi:Ca2+-binding RTX toxin-like protein
VTSVAAGSVAYTFAASASTNSAVTSSVSGIESVIGTTGRDYIVASPAGSGTINGGAGADYLVAGSGVDTFVYATATGATATATLATALTLAENDTIVGAEVISGIAAGDKLDLGHATATAAAGLVVAADKYVIAQGTYNASTGTFTVGASGTTGADSILYWDTDSGTGLVQAGFVVLLGVVTAEEGTATAGVITFA